MKDEWAHMLQFWMKFSSETLASVSSEFKLRYIYHSHPFKEGVNVLYRNYGYYKYPQGRAKKVSDDDYDLLKATNETNPGTFGVVLTNEGIRVHNGNEVVCDIKVTWKKRPNETPPDGTPLPRH